MAKRTARITRLTSDLTTALTTLRSMVDGDDDYLKRDGRFTPKALQEFHLPADTQAGILAHCALLGERQFGLIVCAAQQAIGGLRTRERQLLALEQEAEAERRLALGERRGPEYAFA